MNLNWKESTSPNPFESAAGYKTEFVVYLAEYLERDDVKIRLAIESVIDKAVSLLDENIVNESMYLLFEWDSVYSMLTVVVTDEAKETDSVNVVKCSFPALDEEMNSLDASDEIWEKIVNEYASSVSFWIKDYLSVCSKFLNYSLVAIFHNESRENSQLL